MTIWMDEERAMDARSVYISFTLLLTRNPLSNVVKKVKNGSIVDRTFWGEGWIFILIQKSLLILDEALPLSSVNVGISEHP